ncbi:MAG: UDP-glucose 4-epimerase [Solirubrobacteraceae bacterium]|jgi:UDP-glucose 4-epimerase|nr:UDP-glucose 4-epimerase [Solirubrobacteraceae bacterium]
MRVLVTGGAGFIGSHVVDGLRAAGHEPVVFDVRRLRHHHAGAVEALRGDVLDRRGLARAAAGCDAIAHLAAAADVDEVRAHPAAAEELNARGTVNVLEAARAAGVSRVIYASTIWVYSEAGTGGPVDEASPLLAPAHLYAATKLAGEMYCRSYEALYGVPCTILRFGIPYGPRARPAAVVPAFVGRALDGEPLTIHGGGGQRRPLVYVEDLADGVVRALAPCAAGRTYNLVGDTQVSVRQIAETVRDLLGTVEIEHAPGRAADFAGVEISGARATREIGWRATTPLRDGIARYIEWETARRRPPAPVARAARARAMLLAPTVRAAAVTVAAVLAGMLAAVLARYDSVSDGAGLLGLMSLVGLPLALVARIDWARDRRRAALVAVAMLGGAGFASVIVSVAAEVDQLVRHHALLFLVGVLVSVAAGGYATRPAPESG